MKNHKIKSVTVAIMLLAMTASTTAKDFRSESQADYEARLKWFTEARFGMFIHWGPVSIKGTEIGWSRGSQVKREVYDNLYRQFDPTKFNAAEWVSIAKQAGMKYIVITSKHHGGFSIFDSKLTDYDIMSTPYGKDVMKALSKECEKQGIIFCTYYSILDWYHPDYNTAGTYGGPGYRLPEGTEPDMDRYVAFMKGQLREIVEGYGPIGIMWFDGEWEEPWSKERGWDLYQYVRSLQLDIIVNNRVGKGRQGMQGQTKSTEYAGDYDTPEQRIGNFQIDRPWETCMTICMQWAWKPDDQMKTLKQCLHTLIRTAGGDGNLLFNVGPMPDGRIEPRQVERLKEMGKWLKEYGQSIYGTAGGPFKPGPWGVSTRKDNRIYLHILKSPGDALTLPPIDRKIKSATLLTNGEVTVRQSDEDITLLMSTADISEIDKIVVLELDGNAMDIEPVEIASISLAFEKKASTSNVYRNMNAQYGPAMAFDDKPESRWATDSGTKQAWLAVDLGKEQIFDSAFIAEAYPGRVQKFQLQYKDGDIWIPFHEGTTIGETKSIVFNPQTARHVRLNILEANDGPTITEFQLMAKKQ